MSVHVRNLSHVYSPGMPGEQKALDDVSFDIYDGETAAVIGHTGSGKSTLLQHLNGLLKPTEGAITVDGTDITDPTTVMRDVRRRVGLVFQYPEYQLFEETVALDVAYGPRNLGLDKADTDERVRSAMDLVGLNYEEIADRSPFELSGGQKRRVAIAGIIAMRPRVLILDEPTAGLDPGAHGDILSMIRKIHESEGNIIIFVSHNMADVASMADRVIVMDQGRLIMQGTPNEVFANKTVLNKIGLDVPPVTDLMHTIKNRGADVNAAILDIRAAEDEIFRFLSSRAREVIE